MLVLERTKSNQLLYMQALLRRLHEHDEHFRNYQSELNNLEAGYFGEQRIDREFTDFTMPHAHYLLHNVELRTSHGASHQIDSIVLTSHFLLILEIKNITGTLLYKPHHHEFSRLRKDGIVENFMDPFEQAYRHQLFIERLLHSWHIRLPVEYAVVIVNQNAVLDESLRGYPIFHLTGLRRYIHHLFLKYPTCDVELENVSKRLLALIDRHPPKRRVNDTDRLKKGVLCVKCDFKSWMEYENRSWCCRTCGTRDKNALRWALHDYRLLIGERITNQQFREFVGIESMQVASKILSRLGFEKIGDKRGRFYIIPEDCLLND